MKGLLASKEVIDSIFVDENLNFKVRIDNIVLASGATLPAIYDDEILYDGFKYDDAIGSDDKFDIIGSIIARSLTVVLYNNAGKYSDYEFEGMTCRVSVSQSATTYWFAFGKFIVVDAVYSENSITLSMLDIISKLDVPYVDEVGEYPVTLNTILSRVHDITGYNIYKGYLDADRLFVLNNYEVYNALDPESVTCRDVIGWIAGIIGCFVTTNIYCYNGQTYYAMIHFRYPGCAMLSNSTFSQPDFLVVDENNEAHVDPRLVTSDGEVVTEVTGAEITMSAPILKSFFKETIAVSDVRITGIKVVVNDLEDSNVYEYLCGSDDYCITIQDNQLITNETAQDVADFIGGNYINLTFRKCNVSHIGNILLEAGDFIYVTDSKGNEHRTLITRTTIDIGKPQTVICGCEDIASNGRMISSQATKNYSAAKQKISKLREELDQLSNELDQQYFWHDETGQHIGSHITQQKRADFVEDPEHAGYNAHFTTNSLTLRDGLTNLAEFAADHVQLGQNDEVRTRITNNSNILYDPYGTKIYEFRSNTDKDGNTWMYYNGSISVPIETSSSQNISYKTSIISFEALYGSYSDKVVEISSVTGTWNGVNYNLYVDSVDYENKQVVFATHDDASSLTGQTVTFAYRIYTKMHETVFKARVGTDLGTAWGTNSVALGVDNKATLSACMAFGVGLNATGSGQVALGKYNVEDERFRLNVGNGNDDSNRKTTFGVGTNDNAYMYVDANASASSMDGQLVTDIEALSQSSYLLDTNYYNMLNLKRVFHYILDKLKVWPDLSNHRVVYHYGDRVDTDIATWSTLDIHDDGLIEFTKSYEIDDMLFSTQIGNTGWYKSDYSYYITYPTIITPGNRYGLIQAPHVNVNIVGQPAYGDADIFFGVYGCKARNSSTFYFLKDTSPSYLFMSNQSQSAHVILSFHVIGRWK